MVRKREFKTESTRVYIANDSCLLRIALIGANLYSYNARQVELQAIVIMEPEWIAIAESG